MNPALGGAIAVVSGSGFPHTQFAIARLGRPAAAIVTVVTAGILAMVTGQGLEAARTRGWQVGWVELVRRIALGALFGICATRFRSCLAVQARPGS